MSLGFGDVSTGSVGSVREWSRVIDRSIRGRVYTSNGGGVGSTLDTAAMLVVFARRSWGPVMNFTVIINNSDSRFCSK